LTEQENVFDTLQSNIEEKLQTSKLEMLKSSQTKQSADLLSKQLDIAAKVLKDLQTRLGYYNFNSFYIYFLESFDSVTDEELADLEDKIREQEESIEKAINEHDIEQYKSTLQKMDQTKSSLKREIHELQVDQMQLEAILDNIPSKCFNNPGIEKE
jgi:chromosome segregation ATPase